MGTFVAKEAKKDNHKSFCSFNVNETVDNISKSVVPI
jgi:hypothetical protein